MSDVFLSYARDDRDRVEPLVELLESNGLSVWWDHEIIPGSTFEKVIDEAILEAKLVIVVWTLNSVKSDWVQAEASDGLERGILIPILMDEVRIPVAFRGKQSVNLLGWPERKSSHELERLLSTLHTMLGNASSTYNLPAESDGLWYFVFSFIGKFKFYFSVIVLFFMATIGYQLQPKEDNVRENISIEPVSLVASIAVLPFTNIGNAPGLGRYEGLAFEIAAILRRAGSLQITTEEQVSSYLDEIIGGMVSSLDTTYQLKGSIEVVAEGGSQLTVILSENISKEPLWTKRYRLSQDTIPGTVRAVAEDVTARLNVSLPLLQADIDSRTYVIYLKAQAELRKPHSLEILHQSKVLFEKVIAIEPRFAEAFAGLCRTELALYQETQAIGNFESAEKHCIRANTLNNNDSSVYIALGALYRDSGKLQESIDYLRRAIQLTPFSTSAMRELSKTLIAQNKYDEAEQQLQTALEIESGYWLNYREMGRIHFMKGDYLRAAEYYELESELSSDNSRALNNLGVAYFLAERFEQAIKVWQNTKNLNENDRTLSNLGSAYFWNREFELAAAMYKRAIKVAPENHEYWSAVGESLSQLGREDYKSYYQKALDLAEPRLAINPNDSMLLSAVATYYAAMGEAKKADEIIAILLATYSDDIYVVYDIARATARLGREVDTKKYLDQLISMGYSKTLLSLDANFDEINLQENKEN
jgi:tetratricopeptide (TPR) repeat protein